MSTEELIKYNEGLRLQTYDDFTGLVIGQDSSYSGTLTIGYGHTGEDVVPGKAITQLQAETLFYRDCRNAQSVAIRVLRPGIWRRIDPVRKAVLTDMAYQLGEAGLRRFHLLLGYVTRAVDDKTVWPFAAQELLDSAYGKEVPDRAMRNRDMIVTGDWPSV